MENRDSAFNFSVDELPSGWNIKELISVADINKNSLKKENDLNEIEYIDISSVGTRMLETTTYYNNDNAPSRAKRIIKDGDTIISTVRPNRKSYLYIENPKKNMIASTGFAVISPKNIDKNYIHYYLTSDGYINYLVANATGSAYPAVNADIFKKSYVIVPKENDARKIGMFLKSIDDKIKLNNEINKTLEEMAQAIFKSWFVDFEPFKNGEFEESELGMIPRGYRVGLISDLCDVSSSKRIFMADYRDEGVPFYRGKEIIEKAKGNEVSTEIYIDNIKFNEIKEKFGSPQKGDLLLTSVGTIGIPYLVRNEEFYFKDGNLTWFKDFKLDGYNLYLYYWIKFGEGKNNIDKITIGSTQKALTISALKGMKIVIPNDKDIKKFSKYIESIVQRYEKNITESNTLKNIRDILLSKLISGKIQI